MYYIKLLFLQWFLVSDTTKRFSIGLKFFYKTFSTNLTTVIYIKKSNLFHILYAGQSCFLSWYLHISLSIKMHVTVTSSIVIWLLIVCFFFYSKLWKYKKPDLKLFKTIDLGEKISEPFKIIWTYYFFRVFFSNQMCTFSIINNSIDKYQWINV